MKNVLSFRRLSVVTVVAVLAGCGVPQAEHNKLLDEYTAVLEDWKKSKEQLDRLDIDAIEHVASALAKADVDAMLMPTMRNGVPVLATDERKYFCAMKRDAVVGKLRAEIGRRSGSATLEAIAVQPFDEFTTSLGRAADEPIYWYTSQAVGALRRVYFDCIESGNFRDPIKDF